MLIKRYPINRLKKHQVTSLIWVSLAVCFVFSMVIQPKVIYDGSISGLKAWWNIVFPSLLPFFIASEVLMKLGLVRLMGYLLEPIMRPVFNVPGSGAFVMVIGFTSGFPIGSMITAQLRQKGLCTRIEAERLMSFTNNSSPLFMLTAVSVGMFGNPNLGIVIAGSHYLANLILGILLRFYGHSDRELQYKPPQNSWSIKQAIKILLDQDNLERKPLGQLLGESVASSITKLLNIGGFIILFAVIIRLLQQLGVITLLASFLGLILIPLGLSPDILTALASGMFEMTIGTKMASEASAPELQRLLAVAMILGWSGLSIHAQVASMISGTDIRMKLFVLTRIAHASLATLFTWLFYSDQTTTALYILPVLGPIANNFPTSFMSLTIICLLVMLLSIITLIIFGLIIHFFLRVKLFFR